jgi:polyisoprenoid-binding protein YceI
MKKLFIPTITGLFSFFIFSCSNAPESDKAAVSDSAEVVKPMAAEALKVDTSASKLEWVATKVSGYHTGVIPIKAGELQVKDGNLAGGMILLDMKGLAITGPKENDAATNKKLLTHLQSRDFFEIDSYPEAKFEITNISPFSGTVKDSIDPRQEEISKYKVQDPTHTISGNLTLRGITKNVSFPAKLSVTGDVVTSLAKFNINRKDWNIMYPGKPDDLIRDEIHLGISLKASK